MEGDPAAIAAVHKLALRYYEVAKMAGAAATLHLDHSARAVTIARRVGGFTLDRGQDCTWLTVREEHPSDVERDFPDRRV